jgi:hypothetical protein
MLDAKVLFLTWFYLIVFWVVFCIAFLFVIGFVPKGVPKVLSRLEGLASFEYIPVAVMDAIFVISLLAIIWVYSGLISVPRTLVTPVGHIGNLHVLPVTAAWILYFRSRPIGPRRFVFLIPGILLYLLSPYKEHVMQLFLCVAVAYITFAKHMSQKRLLMFLGTVLALSFIITPNYRILRWGVDTGRKQSLFVSMMVRYHGFDSMCLTVFAIPSIVPFSKRFVVQEAVYRIIPRALLYTKNTEHRGREFSTGIWAFTESGRAIRRLSAPIAPSMPGDLYGVNGLSSLMLGAFLFGCIVGFLDRWVRFLRPGGKCFLIVLFGVPAAMGIERDFAYVVSHMAHVLILLLLFAALLPLKPVGLHNKVVK